MRPSQDLPHPHPLDHNEKPPNRPAGWFKRTVVWVVTASILNTVGLPLVHAQLAQRNQLAWQQSLQSTPADQYAELLSQLVKTLNPEPGTLGAAPLHNVVVSNLPSDRKSVV